MIDEDDVQGCMDFDFDREVDIKTSLEQYQALCAAQEATIERMRLHLKNAGQRVAELEAQLAQLQKNGN